MAGRGGLTSFNDLVNAVGDKSSVDGTAPGAVVVPRSGLSRSAPLKDLMGNPHNPRDFLGDLGELASIVEFQLQPVVVVTKAAFQKLYPDTEVPTRWVVVIGNRRLAAAKKFGRPDLDIVIKDELAKDRATLKTAVISENVDRAGFDVIEEAKAVESLVQESGSADAAAKLLRKSKTWVSQRRDLLKLAPELQEATRRSDLAIREARNLARLPREEQIAKWNATLDKRKDPVGEGSGPATAGTSKEPGEPTSARSVSRALKKFDTEPNALAMALREQLGESGAKTLVTALRKLLK